MVALERQGFDPKPNPAMGTGDLTSVYIDLESMQGAVFMKAADPEMFDSGFAHQSWEAFYQTVAYGERSALLFMRATPKTAAVVAELCAE